MLSVSVTDPVRQFMNRIMREDVLDAFLLREAVLVSRTRVHLYGALEDGGGGFASWAEMKPAAAELIKLGGKPKSLKLVLSARQAKREIVPASAGYKTKLRREYR